MRKSTFMHHTLNPSLELLKSCLQHTIRCFQENEDMKLLLPDAAEAPCQNKRYN